MNKEEIIRMAREANIKQAIETPHLLMVHELERFAALVAAAERDQTRELLERCETEMRYSGWTKYQSDNPARHEVYQEVKEFLARGKQ